MAFYESNQYSRDSVGTFDSERSINTASSIFSLARSSSRASTNTAYSSNSLPHVQPASSDPQHGWPALIGPEKQRAAQMVTDTRRLALHTATQRAPPQTTEANTSPISPATRQHTPLAEKQVNNKFACSHCREVFTKKSDRKKHWHNRCQYLGDPKTPDAAGDAFVCPQCDHVARNEDQKRRHQKISGHKGDWQPIRLCQKARYTCSNHDTIFHNAHAFYAHFERDSCPLNHHSGGKDGYRYHQARVTALLQEGRDELRGRHSYLYAALLTHCHHHGMRSDAWRPIVQRLPAEEALAIANRLEWGLQDARESAISRLGFTDVMEMVAKAVPSSALYDSAQGITLRTAHDPSSLAVDKHDTRSPSQPLVSRFDASAQRKFGPSALDAVPEFTHAKAQSQQRQQRAGFAVHKTQPLPRENSKHLPDAWADAHHDEGRNLRHSEDMSSQQFIDNSHGMQLPEMQAVENATPLFLAGMAQRILPEQHQTHRREEDEWEIVGQVLVFPPNNSASDLDHYPESQALTPSPTKDAYPEWPFPAPPSRKRPISTSSSVLPDSIARSRAGPTNRLALRPASKDFSTSAQTTQIPTSPRTSQRSSGESVVGKWFNYANYYEQPPTPTLLLPGTKGAAYSDPTNYQQSPTALPERSRSAGQAVKAVFRKMTTPSVREISEAAFEQMPAPPARTRPISRCVHCGRVNDISCLTTHISDQDQTQSRHNRRNGSVLDPTAVADAFHEFDPAFDLFTDNDSYDF
ncbi:hypothetical protein CERZMDRAFT_87543 [Cercospora zeae-maydis SCOH1-5]|uniref:Uncharacterized protein n=1 Tax=Cercospora zeae-maydis SCOH1-5 TaxID=717836 RepID=A0A6A6F4Q2_9PEZI|nr:hypothetical protein CERZMDRAFT_87543 [Cercospora zeae-maydis SCOH1-5]